MTLPVTETGDAYLVELDVPGYRRRDISIELAGSELVVSGAVKERQGWFRYRTRRVGRFTCRVTLPRDVESDGVRATLADGVLTVRVPKTEAARRRRIPVTAH